MAINYETDTISAVATPFGTGAIGIIRMSGDKSFEICEKIFSKKLIPSKIMYGTITDEGEMIDEAVVLPYKAPTGYTGEDAVEIQCHGGINIVRKILQLTYKYGARPAEKGEFTKRAFLNGKMDLSKAEAVADVIHAKTTKFAVKSASNLAGKLSQKISEIYQLLFDLLSEIIAAVDFPEDVAEPEYSYLEEKLKDIIAEIEKVSAFSKSSDVLRQGVKVAIVGKPNVGKSSLFNVLLNFERAIVTDTAGTTRDAIREMLDIDGIPVTIIDTAGLRDETSADKIEIIGMDFTKKCIDESDAVLFLFDSQTGMTKEDEDILKLTDGKPVLKVATKFDLSGKTYGGSINISSVSGENIERLKTEIKNLVCENLDEETEFITNERQQNCLNKALESCKTALDGVLRQELQDLISIDVKTALLQLGEIKGELVTDDILNNIFDHFCIGK
ncbi:MAG: tRNA uridine-5-carboxymethylaminomethyl(34) synthesis GTPase MnmE [Candidatus Gastranaerophilales bacterium]|nr:tRNA uridine-5-carboxymethylaminomethyl(34) synthesis GTPase MnmE [Candidatus Gastranaerophilales bacterium]